MNLQTLAFVLSLCAAANVGMALWYALEGDSSLAAFNGGAAAFIALFAVLTMLYLTRGRS